MTKRYIVHLKDEHRKRNLTAYAVARDTGLNKNTVRKFLENNVELEYLPAHVITICEYFGLNWKDPNVIEIYDDESPDDEDTDTKNKTLLALPA